MRILSTIDRELLKPSSSVALHRHSNSLVDVLPPEADSSIQLLGNDEKPDVSYADIGTYPISLPSDMTLHSSHSFNYDGNYSNTLCRWM